ncbi:hypothetical protein M514_00976 [Trichuris suis]|uniref:MULE transposase domain-containing protein n=1 Tax=Trichuris suis TaxID=68888 RepID=A0A085NLY1_9BILA|nr:hypothetical protein M513_00976 [Trichuris suis]KFD70477.1 hypothetical protein M514_00976 [Trichuris suis]
MKTATATFPDVQVYDCFFHLVRNLKRSCRAGSAFKIQHGRRLSVVRLSGRLACVCASRRHEQAIVELPGVLPRELLPVLARFENIRLGRLNSFGGRDIPQSLTNVWLVYQRRLMNHDRTNNFVGVTHRQMQMALGCERPTVLEFGRHAASPSAAL